MRKLLYLSFLLLLSVSLVGTVSAQKDQQAVLFEEDFENGTVPQEIFLSAQWKVATTDVDGVQSGVLRGNTKGVEGLFLDVGFEWTDYAYEVKFRVSSGAGISMYTRITQNLCEQGYIFDFFPATDYVTYSAFVGTEECDTNTLTGQLPYTMPVNEWITARLEVEGTAHRVFLDGELMVEATDTTTSTGSVGLVVFDPTVIEIDYIKITEVAATTTVSSGNTGNLGNVTGNKPEKPSTTALTDYAGTFQEASAELESLGLVPAGGARLFSESYVFADGAAGYVPLARNSNIMNAVFSAEITMKESNELTGCNMIMRLSNNIATFVGLTAAGDAYLIDLADDSVTESAALGLDMTKPHTVTAIFIDDEATVFVDGEPVFDAVPIPRRSGSFGYGVTNNGRCEAHNVWVYEYD